MAQLSWPSPGYNSRAVSDSEYETLAARFSDDGIDGRPTDPAVVTAGPGLSVTIRAGVHGSIRGRDWSSGSTTVNIPIPANSAGSTRTDRIVLRLDRSDWTVRAVRKAGAAGSGPPALTQQLGDTGVYEVPVARVTVLSGAAAVTVVREELYIGTRIRPCTSTTRNPSPVVGEAGFETDTKRLVLWDGKSWRLVFQDSGEVVLQKLNNVSWVNAGDSVLEQRGGAVWLRLGGWTRNGSTLAAASESQLPVLIPEAYLPHTRYQYWNVYITHATTASMARLTIYPRGNARAGQIWLTQHADIRHLDDLKATTMTWTVS